mgnify:CR=1 FL=1
MDEEVNWFRGYLKVSPNRVSGTKIQCYDGVYGMEASCLESKAMYRREQMELGWKIRVLWGAGRPYSIKPDQKWTT